MNFKIVIVNKSSGKSIPFFEIPDYSFFYGRMINDFNTIRLYYKPGSGYMVVSFGPEKGYWMPNVNSIVEDYAPVNVTLTVERIQILDAKNSN